MKVSESKCLLHSRFPQNPNMPQILPSLFLPKSFPISSPAYPRVSKFKQASFKSHRINAEIEIRVCVNRTCRRQGSSETLEILSSLSPPDISVISCGCLGRCGAGPNLVILPDGVLISHCGTAARAAELLVKFCNGGSIESDPSKNLAALALRRKAEEEMDEGNFSEAELILSQEEPEEVLGVLLMPYFLWVQAIDLKPSGGLHIIHKIRSAARLAMGDNSGAFEDADKALKIAPQYPQAYICQGDAFLAIQEFDAAEKSYSTALQIDPSIRRSKSFKARIAKLQEELGAANIPS